MFDEVIPKSKILWGNYIEAPDTVSSALAARLCGLAAATPDPVCGVD